MKHDIDDICGGVIIGAVVAGFIIWFLFVLPLFNTIQAQCDRQMGQGNWTSEVKESYWLCVSKNPKTSCAPFECNVTISEKGF